MSCDIEGPAIPNGADRTSARRRRMVAAAFIAMLLPAIVVACFHWDLPSLGSYHDDGVYLVTAKAIAEGKGYRIESLPDERWETKFPPAFPSALAPVWRLFQHFPENTSAFLMVAWLALPVLILLQARMMAKLEFCLASQFAACLCVLAYQDTLLLSVALLSDLWFCCAVLLTLWLAERATESGAHWRLAVAAGLAAALAFLARGAGIVLLPSVSGVMVLRGRWRNALAFCAVAGPIVAIWSGWSFAHAHPVLDFNDRFYSSYLHLAREQTLAALFPYLAARTSEFLLRLGDGLIPGFLPGAALDWLRCLVGLLGVAGIVCLCRTGKAWHYAAFASLYAAEFCIFPCQLFSRYVLPVVPLWIAGILTLTPYLRPAAAGVRPADRTPRWVRLALEILTGFYIVQSAGATHDATVARRERRALTGAYVWIARNVPPTASVVAFRDPLLYLYTGHHAEGLHSTIGENNVSRILHIAELARRRGHRYVLIGPTDPEFDPSVTRAELSAALESDATCRRVYSANGADVYDVTESRSAPPR